jgi:hypothetical protein
MPLLVPLRKLGERGSRSRVAGKLGKDVELDTWVCGLFHSSAYCSSSPLSIWHNGKLTTYLVEAGSWHTTTQLRRSTALNLEVDTLRVRLSTVDLACSMEGDDLVADHVVAGCDVGDG